MDFSSLLSSTHMGHPSQELFWWIPTSGLCAALVRLPSKSLIWTNLCFRWTLNRIPHFFYPYYCIAGFLAFYHLAHGFLKALQVFRIISYPTFTKIAENQLFRTIVITGGLLVVSGVIAFTDGLYHSSDKVRWPVLDQTLPDFIRPNSQ